MTADLSRRVLALIAGGVGLAQARQALRAGGAPEPDPAVVVARLERWAGRVPEDATDRLAARLQAMGARLLVVGQPGYPRQLATAWPENDAPLWLFATGPAPTLPAVAVVGTRRATMAGRDVAAQVAARLVASGALVLSGMARGIDQAAHRGALRAGGRTAAVLGTGFGIDYPAGSGQLREAVARSGGLVTEYPPGHGVAMPGQFLDRNRILAGLAQAVVVVEGRQHSGALNTASHAARLGRTVIALPGGIASPTAQGPLTLAREGADLLLDLDDLPRLAGLDPDTAVSPPTTEAADPDDPLLDLLGTDPQPPDLLARQLGRPIAEVLVGLADLESAGLAAITARGAVRRGAPP